MHGGDIYRNKTEYDFSINLNPCDTPKQVLEAAKKSLDLIDTYPDIKCENLKRQLSGLFGIDSNCIVCGNGASEILMAVVHEVRPQKALLFAPGFSGYEHVLRAYDTKVSFCFDEFDLDRKIRTLRPDIFIYANPNNPTGRLRTREEIEALADACQKSGTVFVVDECFISLTGKERESSMIPVLGRYKNAIVLRAFTKSFSVPGVRLGFAIIENEKFAVSIERHLPEWNVSVIAQCVGNAACKERKFIEKSAEYIAKEREYLSKELKELGFDVTPSEANYILFYKNESELDKASISEGSKTLYEKLLERGILIRDCSDYKGLTRGNYRISVKKHEDNIYLIEKIKEVLGE